LLLSARDLFIAEFGVITYEVARFIHTATYFSQVNVDFCTLSVLKVEVKSIRTKCPIIDMRGLPLLSMENKVCRGGTDEKWTS
jgi:hypothetical protein